ncbi:hypothetical protein [Arenimonas sp.]|jgi:hypothetical protein|uniref:hypothetical protein n=1 Tax=Arenimonas sp. TaxID=1872635 RepID=UPI0037C18A1E
MTTVGRVRRSRETSGRMRRGGEDLIVRDPKKARGVVGGGDVDRDDLSERARDDGPLVGDDAEAESREVRSGYGLIVEDESDCHPGGEVEGHRAM